jgi:Superfamily II DNA helicase
LNQEIGLHLFNAVKSWKTEEGGLIYCLKQDWAVEFVKYLNGKFGGEMCGIYDAGMEKKERQCMLKNWKDGKSWFLAATSGVGAGLDYGGVRMVIHQGLTIISWWN